MTRYIEVPLRPQGQRWPGLNTRGGRLDPGQGYLEDGSVNAIINEGDILQKRKGLIRGLDERFDGPVCGLFRYTDDCGREFLVVADQEGITVRRPFTIPTFIGSDSFPNDAFNEALDTSRWNNTDSYETLVGSLKLKDSSTLIDQQHVPATRHMTWFKEAGLTSYQAEIQYDLDQTIDSRQGACVTIKRADASNYLQADVTRTSTIYQVLLTVVIGGTRSLLFSQDLTGSSVAEGFLRISYNATTRIASVRVTPTGGSIVSGSGDALSELQDTELGQGSAVGLVNAEAFPKNEILQVTGGAI